MSNNSPFNPWWYYEMGRQNTRRSHLPWAKLTTKQKINLGISLAIFWVFLTPIVAFVIWAFADIFLDWDFWICLVIGGIFMFWLCLRSASQFPHFSKLQRCRTGLPNISFFTHSTLFVVVLRYGVQHTSSPNSSTGGLVRVGSWFVLFVTFSKLAPSQTLECPSDAFRGVSGAFSVPRQVFDCFSLLT